MQIFVFGSSESKDVSLQVVGQNSLEAAAQNDRHRHLRCWWYGLMFFQVIHVKYIKSDSKCKNCMWKIVWNFKALLSIWRSEYWSFLHKVSVKNYKCKNSISGKILCFNCCYGARKTKACYTIYPFKSFCFQGETGFKNWSWILCVHTKFVYFKILLCQNWEQIFKKSFNKPKFSGVLWIANDAIKGSPELIAQLKEIGKQVFVITNNSTKTRAVYAEKCQKLGFTSITKVCICLCVQNFLDF